MFETLESRRLLSVTLDQGVLTVTGTDQPDQIGIGRNATSIVVNDNGTASMWSPTEVESIVVNALEGGDRVVVLAPMGRPLTVNGGPGDDALRGGPGREQLNGGAGDDHLHGGGGGDLLDGGDDNDLIVGGPGHDRMFGRAGNDRFDAFDHDGDFLDGGDGADVARIGRFDRAVNIERVFSGPRPNPTVTAPTDRSDGLADLIDDITAPTATA